MADKLEYTLTGGPSREELFDALRLRHEGRTVWFKGKLSGEAMTRTEEFVVNSITAEDGSGHKWLLVVFQIRERKTADAYFDTNTREGWMREK